MEGNPDDHRVQTAGETSANYSRSQVRQPPSDLAQTADRSRPVARGVCLRVVEVVTPGEDEHVSVA